MFDLSFVTFGIERSDSMLAPGEKTEASGLGRMGESSSIVL